MLTIVSNSRTREYIEKGEKEGRSITDAMSDGELDGMQTFDGVLEKFIREGSVKKKPPSRMLPTPIICCFLSVICHNMKLYPKFVYSLPLPVSDA